MKRGYRNCIKKVAGIIGAVMMASSCGSVVCNYDVPVSITQVSAQQQYNITAEQAKSVMFNAVYYANLYPDLKKAFGYDSGKLYEHYYWYGIQEGRSASPIFDPKYYLENNADLKRAFGVDYKAAYQHWIDYGCAEGRASSKYYSGKYYKEKYRDLQNAYFYGGSNANNYYRLALHYLNYGISEKRQANVHGLVPRGMVRKEAEQYVVSTNGVTLTLRSGPGTNYGIKARMPRGSVVEVYSISNGWANLSYNGIRGYASSQYLSKAGYINNDRVSKALSWVENNLNRKVGTGQCVALIEAYALQLGLSNPIDGGNACDYATSPLTDGWTRVKGGKPQPGDIMVYVGAKYGHVAICAGDNVSFHQNMKGEYVEKKVNWAYNQSWYSTREQGRKQYWGYIRPNI